VLSEHIVFLTERGKIYKSIFEKPFFLWNKYSMRKNSVQEKNLASDKFEDLLLRYKLSINLLKCGDI
jgi:hypothetical protein